MNPQLLQQPFCQVTLPLMATIIVATWSMVSINNRRVDGLRETIKDLRDSMSQRFDGVDKRLDRIETELHAHGERITRLEERTSPLRR